MHQVIETVLVPVSHDQIDINSMQFGFMSRGTTDAIFIISQLQGKYLPMKKDLIFIWTYENRLKVHLAKLYDG